MPSGSLSVVGTGIRLGQLSVEARAYIEQADKVFCLLADPITYSWLVALKPEAESLHTSYQLGKEDRGEAYLDMVERILACLRQELNVCVASYGHPGVFAYPMHEAVQRARREGFRARMIPGISAEDCLFVDLGIDPGEHGCQTFEATDFLLYNRKFDPSSSLVLLQIGVTGEPGYKEEYDLRGLRVLVDVLESHYGSSHETIVYEAARYPACDPIIHRVPLGKVPEAPVTPLSTLYLPPKNVARADPRMIERLGIASPNLRRNVN